MGQRPYHSIRRQPAIAAGVGGDRTDRAARVKVLQKGQAIQKRKSILNNDATEQAAIHHGILSCSTRRNEKLPDSRPATIVAATLRSMVLKTDQAFSIYPFLPAPPGLPLTVLPEHPCAYLPGRAARSRAFYANRIPNDLYRQLMDAGFRRSGRVVYQPICSGCRRCVPIRVPVDQFKPSDSQKRQRRRNADLLVTTHPPSVSDEKLLLYQKYQTQWHGSAESESMQRLTEFLYGSPVDSIEFEYRTPAGQLIGVAICDACPPGLSSVYFYFGPDFAKRSLGVFSTVYEIDWARSNGFVFYYAGFWVHGCKSMEYKEDYRPNELLHADARWRSHRTD